MTNHCLESAFMFYKMAVSKRFTSGRRTIHVLGACLYLVSRTEKTPRKFLSVCLPTKLNTFNYFPNFALMPVKDFVSITFDLK